MAPGSSGTAPTRGSGARPATDNDVTTLWLASVPLLHAAFRLTGGSPTARRAARAAAIFRPITAGTVTPGAVVVVAALVDVEGSVVVVVVVVPMPLPVVFLAAGELPHEERAQAASTPTAPLATSRPHGFMRPSLPLDPPGRPLPAGSFTSRC